MCSCPPWHTPVATGATSSVPGPNLQAMLSGDAAGQAHSPLCDASEDAGINPIPAGLHSNVPLRPEEKSPPRATISSTNMFTGQLHLAGCCFCCLCAPQDAWQVCNSSSGTFRPFPPSLATPSALFQIHLHQKLLPSISSLPCLAPCLLSHQLLPNQEKPLQSSHTPLPGARPEIKYKTKSESSSHNTQFHPSPTPGEAWS